MTTAGAILTAKVNINLSDLAISSLSISQSRAGGIQDVANGVVKMSPTHFDSIVKAGQHAPPVSVTLGNISLNGWQLTSAAYDSRRQQCSFVANPGVGTVSADALRRAVVEAVGSNTPTADDANIRQYVLEKPNVQAIIDRLDEFNLVVRPVAGGVVIVEEALEAVSPTGPASSGIGSRPANPGRLIRWLEPVASNRVQQGISAAFQPVSGSYVGDQSGVDPVITDVVGGASSNRIAENAFVVSNTWPTQTMAQARLEAERRRRYVPLFQGSSSGPIRAGLELAPGQLIADNQGQPWIILEITHSIPAMVTNLKLRLYR